ncbi:Elongator protein 3/MiaB/NifB [Syntrophomonas zehnderi OL-4]|uniref:Elongator protein 3/MiaB/NifB n=1 Tax=Syntrophomonas zehnderi OL-4 TaxID=690567 RepID=A0A0E3W3S4_9FIRM|nr:radical SAM protein [Syntrophomonas zehnderi]CFY01763.1 Elongator protein 3/MiaB/NifB [Syntrophomonas zehnderi OL-4]
MKILLIEPKAPGRHVYSTVTMPRLGLPLLGTELKAIGHEVRFIYGSRTDICFSDLDEFEMVGISATTSTVPEAYHLADMFKKKGIPVVMGGPHVTFLPEEALAHCDYVCRGEAEESFPELVRCLEKNVMPAHVAGLSWWQAGKPIHNSDAAPAELNRLPIPDLSIFDDFNKMTTYPVMTSRGCPFDCTFCSVTAMFGHKVRTRDYNMVLEELKQYAGKQVFFCDDNFAANPYRVKTLLLEMIIRKLCPQWWCAQVRTEAARDEELLSLMKEAGCGLVFVGMESINPQTLQSYKKKQDIADIEFCVKQFHKFGIMVHGMFVFGADEDTPQTIRDTVKFARKNRIDTVQFMVLTPLPGTRTYQDMEKAGRLLTRDWSLYDAHHVVFEPALMSAYTLQKETMRAYRKFYTLFSLGRNLFLTGKRSFLFKAAGWYVARKWDRENAWYYETLRKEKSVARLELSAKN